MSQLTSPVSEKPLVGAVVSETPTLKSISGESPNLSQAQSPTETERFYNVTIQAGQWMGFLSYTYPETLIVSTSKSP